MLTGAGLGVTPVASRHARARFSGMADFGNKFAGLPQSALPMKVMTTLVSAPNLRIEPAIANAVFYLPGKRSTPCPSALRRCGAGEWSCSGGTLCELSRPEEQ